MKGIKALITPKPKALFALDDFGRACLVRKRMVFPHGEMIVGVLSYQLVRKERKAEGIKCPSWGQMERYYES